jgi:sugar/nucleoside kinase (ribokinase family)
MKSVFGIGNPLIDVVIQASDADLAALALDKGIMHLVSEDRQREILDHFGTAARTYRPGGAAPNTLIALAGLGIPATICGKIGNDEFGRTYNEQVAAYGITSRLMSGDGATGSSIILVTPDGERTMNTHLGMCQEFGVADLDEELLAASDYLYFTGYMWDTEVQKGAIRRALEVAHRANVLVAFDLADPFAVERYRDDFIQLLETQVDILFANRTEAAILFGSDDPMTAAGELGSRVRIAALKVGKEGSIVVERPESSTGASAGPRPMDGPTGAGHPTAPIITPVPGRPIGAVDSTGAGDMFAAGFLAALARGRSAVAAARAAGWLAEEIIQQVGAQFSVDHIRQLREKMDAAVE